jgi:hypothetical protein
MHRAVGTEGFQASLGGARRGAEDRMLEILEGVERNLNDLVQGLGLLGVKRCSHCKQFYRASDRGRLFTSNGETVCFECIPAWWAYRREQLDCEDQQKMESDLVYWLRGFHNARSYRDSKLPDSNDVKFELTASCHECHGTGMHFKEKRCRYCSGPGTVRIVVPKEPR